MQSFAHYTPTEIFFGKDAQLQTPSLIQKHGGNKVFIVYGMGSVLRSGLLAQVTDLLVQAHIPYQTFGGVKPNPITSHVQEGIAKALDCEADFILALGGGSAIDEAKAIALGVKNQTADIWPYWNREREVTASLPVGVVLTISAAGSETSRSAVLTHSQTGEKRGLTTEWNIPCFAVMNPELTYTVPPFQMACGIVDIMMHTLDRFFTQTQGNQMTDALAVALLRTVMANGPVALQSPRDYHAVSEIMWCGSLSHNGLTGLGRPMDFSVHQLGHELSGRFDVPHGASLSTMWGAWAKYCYRVDVGRFAWFAQKVWDVDCEDGEKAALEGIDKTICFFQSLGMPVSMSDLGIGILSAPIIAELADSCVFHGKRLVGNFRPLHKEDIIAIYHMANL